MIARLRLAARSLPAAPALATLARATLARATLARGSLALPVVALVAVALAVLAPRGLVPGLAPATASAQQAAARQEGEATGSIEGAVRNGTEGATLASDLTVMLIRLEGGQVAGSEETQVQDGRYRFPVDPTRDATYVLRTIYGGIQYLSDALRVSADQPNAVHDLTVYETTTEPPPLTIEQTIVTVVALDRQAGELTLLREDRVANPSDRVYVAPDGEYTLTIPAPDGATAADGMAAEGEFVFEGGAVATTSPLRPGVTPLLTQYTVPYDVTADRHLLRAIAPLEAERVALRVPARFVRSAEPAVPARRAEDTEVEGERLMVFERTGVRSGQGVVAELTGLSGIEPATNPLTEPAGAAAGAAVALAVLAGAAFVATRVWPRNGPDGQEEAA